MQILMLGANHRTAPVEWRERLSLAGERLDRAFDQVRSRYPLIEMVVISTCNRTELYIARPELEAPSLEQLRVALAEVCGVESPTLEDVTVHLKQEQAVGHLFRVTAGLDSMVVGEPQILGQVKRAYDAANRRHAVGPVLHRVFQQAVATAKQVRAHTGMDERRVSIASVAANFARQIFSHFEDKTIVAIGAGEMAKITLAQLQTLKPARLWIANRSAERAQNLAAALKLDQAVAVGGPRRWEELDELLVEADILVTSTGSTQPIITADRFKPLLRRRKGRPLFIIDIALPRDVDAHLASFDNVYLYNLDDLQSIVAQSLGAQDEKLTEGQALIDEAVRSCISQIQNRDIGQLIRALRTVMHDIGRAEQQRAAAKLIGVPLEDLPDKLDQVLEEHTHRVVNKILHLPLSRLDQRDGDAPLGFTAAALRYLFKLDDHLPTEEENEPEPKCPARQSRALNQTSEPA